MKCMTEIRNVIKWTSSKYVRTEFYCYDMEFTQTVEHNTWARFLVCVCVVVVLFVFFNMFFMSCISNGTLTHPLTVDQVRVQ